MKSLTLIAAILVIATAIMAVVQAEVPSRTLPLKPRHEWKSVKLDGRIEDRTAQRWVGMIGNTKKEFSWTNGIDSKPLAFVDDATYRRAEQLVGFPVLVTAIPISRGESTLWVVESISETN